MQYGVEVDVENCCWIGSDETYRAEIIRETIKILNGHRENS